MDREPSASGLTIVSKKGMEPSSLLSSTVNFMAGSTLFVLKEALFVGLLVDDKGVKGREGHNLARNIKESIYIRVNNPSLNNNIGKFNLSHIWDRVLLNTKGLTLK